MQIKRHRAWAWAWALGGTLGAHPLYCTGYAVGCTVLYLSSPRRPGPTPQHTLGPVLYRDARKLYVCNLIRTKGPVPQ